MVEVFVFGVERVIDAEEFLISDDPPAVGMNVAAHEIRRVGVIGGRIARTGTDDQSDAADRNDGSGWIGNIPAIHFR